MLLLVALIGASALSCRDSAPASEAGGSSEQPRYATTIYAFRAILEPVVGSTGTVHNLLPAGASPHTYEPRPSDVRAASKSRVLFYGAPELDQWAAHLGEAKSIALIDLLPDSMLLDLSDRSSQGGHDHASGRDPHFWMDPISVDALLPALVDRLCEIDAATCSIVRNNAHAFSQRLRVLDDSVRTVMAPVQGSSVLLSHPFIQYFAERYGLRTAGVIEEMPGAEPTARGMQRLIHEVKRTDVGGIITLPQLSDRAAQAVSEAVGIPVLELDPNGGSSGRRTYEELILHNAHVLRRGLVDKDG